MLAGPGEKARCKVTDIIDFTAERNRLDRCEDCEDCEAQLEAPTPASTANAARPRQGTPTRGR
jgi:hypothetical protein